MGLLRYTARRLVTVLVALFGLSVLMFFVSHSLPGDPAVTMLGPFGAKNATLLALVRHQWGLDKPVPVQYLIYISNLLQGNLGISQHTGHPVLYDLELRFPVSLELVLYGLFFAIAIGIPLGVISAVKRNKWPDHLARLLAVSGAGMPVFFFGYIMLIVFYLDLRWVGIGRLPSNIPPPTHITGLYTLDSLLTGNLTTLFISLNHILLPAFVLGFTTAGIVARLTRSSMIDVISQDYIRTARAKGQRERIVILRHALRNALIPVVTILGIGFGQLLAGTVLLEVVFDWHGLGSYALESILSVDFNGVMGVSIVIGVVFILSNFVVDLLYGVLDPRIRID